MGRLRQAGSPPIRLATGRPPAWIKPGPRHLCIMARILTDLVRRRPILGPDTLPPRLHLGRPCGKNRPRLVAALEGRFPRCPVCCRSSVVEHSLGKGEVDSSILSGSTMGPRAPPLHDPLNWPNAQLRGLAARFASELCWSTALAKTQGRREGRAPAAPVARLQKEKQAAVTTGWAENTRPSLRDGLTAYTRSPWGPALLPPSPACASKHASLTPAPGGQDHTISPSARTRSSAFKRMLRARTATAPRLHVRDDRDTPLAPRRDVGDIA